MPADSATSCLRADGDGILLAIRVAPRAGRTAVAGARAGRLVVQTTAPPVDGRANDAVCRALAKTLGVASRRVTLVAGTRGRDKLVRVDGVDLQHAAAKLGVTVSER